jgi:hypothetical protein
MYIWNLFWRRYTELSPFGGQDGLVVLENLFGVSAVEEKFHHWLHVIGLALVAMGQLDEAVVDAEWSRNEILDQW